jgi:UDP-N-acetylmuramate dehydrogenase
MPKFQENVPLAKFSHYKIGGPARYFFVARSEREVRWAVREAKKRALALFVLGGGTNLLIGDGGFDGLVLKPELGGVRASGVRVTAGAGATMADVLKFTAGKSLAGLEWAGGLPGTVGGAVRGNAGCFGGEMKDSVVSVRSFDAKAMKVITRTGKQCRFAYRDSVFKKKNGAEIILSVTFALAKGNKKDIARVIKERIRYRAEHHPLEHPNIGSIFKNVPLHAIHAKGSAKYVRAVDSRSLAYRGSAFSVKTDPFPVVSTGKMISEAGLRGVSRGGAMISPKHPNFIVNALGAQAEDVSALITLAKSEVRRRFGVRLEEEVQLL